MNILEKMLIKTGNSMIEAEIKLKEKTGIDLMKMTYDAVDADEKLKKNHPGKWIVKKLAKGTVKDILAGTLGVHLFGGESSK